MPLREAAVRGFLMVTGFLSCTIKGLGVKLHDILFMLHCQSITVALTFTERWFYVSFKFTEEPLYASACLDYIDITVPLENLIKKLYQMYEQEEQEKKTMHEKQDHEEGHTLMRQQKEHERNKLEDLQRRKAESKKQKHRRKEMKEAGNRMKGEQEQRKNKTMLTFAPRYLPFWKNLIGGSHRKRSCAKARNACYCIRRLRNLQSISV